MKVNKKILKKNNLKNDKVKEDIDKNEKKEIVKIDNEDDSDDN